MLLRTVTRFFGCVALLGLLLAGPLARAQSWTTMPIGFYPGTMILMTDGTVLVHYVTEDSSGNLNPSGIWERLTPDAFGNYADGTWSQLPPMPTSYAPADHATAVLPDGRLLVEGGEYNEVSGVTADTALGAIYDPVSNSWTSVNPPPGAAGQGNYGYGGGQNGTAFIGDASSTVLPDGQLMLGDCCGDYFALFDAADLSWNSYFDEGKFATDVTNGEEGWVLLPNGKVLTVNLWGDANGNGAGTTSTLYDPATNSWSPSGNIPVSVEDPTCHEIGPMVLRRDGTVTVVGGNGQLATYNSFSGTWSAGPLIGSPYGDDDGPGVLLPDGNVFFEVSPWNYAGFPDLCGPDHPSPGVVFFEWDGTTLTEEPGPPDEPDDSYSFAGRMLVLPTGQVVYANAYYGNNKDLDKNLYLYTPAGTYQAAWQPQITSVASTLYTDTVNNSISGTQFNGRSQGSMYGDDEQMAENFPLVYIKNISTGHVFYCRTHNFSTMAVATGSATVSAEFDIPPNVETGPSDLVVVTDGIPSPPVSVTVDYGPGQQNVTVSPTSLSFTSIDGSTPSESATLLNNGPGTLGINGEWTDGGGDFSVSSTTCRSTLAQGGSCTATVTFSPGPYCLSSPETGTLYFSDSATSGEQAVSLKGTTSRCLQIPDGGPGPKAAKPAAQPPGRAPASAGGGR